MFLFPIYLVSFTLAWLGRGYFPLRWLQEVDSLTQNLPGFILNALPQSANLYPEKCRACCLAIFRHYFVMLRRYPQLLHSPWLDLKSVNSRGTKQGRYKDRV